MATDPSSYAYNDPDSPYAWLKRPEVVKIMAPGPRVISPGESSSGQQTVASGISRIKR